MQFGQVLTALQSDTREDLQHVPAGVLERAARARARAGFNQAIKHWEEAYANDARRSTTPRSAASAHDLTRVLDGQAKVFGALSRDEEALKDLVTDLNGTIVAASRAQEDNLRAAIPELRDVLREGRPALASLNTRAALDPRASRATRCRARAPRRHARRAAPVHPPGARADRPSAELARPRRASCAPTRAVAGAAEHGARPRTLAQNRALASCQNHVLLPFAKTPIPDPDFAVAHRRAVLRGVAARASSGCRARAASPTPTRRSSACSAGGGPTTVVATRRDAGEPLFAQRCCRSTACARCGRPSGPCSGPDVPCETQEPPDLNAAGGGRATSTVRRRARPRALTAEQRAGASARSSALRESARDSRAGKPARRPADVDPAESGRTSAKDGDEP